MRYLPISICLLLVVACGSYPEKHHFHSVETTEKTIVNPFFSETAWDYIYKASITFNDNDFGGLFIVKKLGERHHRIAFTTEMGNKIFDISLYEDKHEVHYIPDKLDRKPLIKLLTRDFRVLTREKNPVVKSYSNNTRTVFETVLCNKKYYYHTHKGVPVKVVRANAQTVFLFSDISDNIAGDIRIMHKNIKLNINLKAIH